MDLDRRSEKATGLVRHNLSPSYTWLQLARPCVEPGSAEKGGNEQSQLYSLGYCISYDEVSRFRQSVLLEQTLESLSPPHFPVLAQYGADNADSNIRIIDCSSTIHSMVHYTWYRKSAVQDVPDH